MDFLPKRIFSFSSPFVKRAALGQIMGGAPRMAVISAITDHTAHHRGALTVYARMNTIVPPMPYM